MDQTLDQRIVPRRKDSYVSNVPRKCSQKAVRTNHCAKEAKITIFDRSTKNTELFNLPMTDHNLSPITAIAMGKINATTVLTACIERSIAKAAEKRVPTSYG